MSRSRSRRCWTGVRCAARAAAGPACGRGVWLATRATAARPLGAACAVAASGRSFPTKSNRAARAVLRSRGLPARNRVERLINRLKQFRRIATRYEKRAANYLAMLTIGMILLWL